MARRTKEANVKKKSKKPFPQIPQKTSNLKGTFPNKKHPKTGPTETEIIAALTKTHGMLSKAARILGCDRKTISNRLKEFPSIGQALEESEAHRLDEAETSLDRNIKNGHQKAIEFFLKNKGKSRGYGQDPKDDEPDLQTVIEKFQKALEETRPTELPKQPVIETPRTEWAAKLQRPRVGTRLE